MNDFFRAVRNFLIEYLPNQRCYSKNTVKSYRDSLNLLVEYLRTEKCMKISMINFDLFDRELVLGYLDWLEQTRLCCAATRNQRLMVLRSFFKYAGILDCSQVALQLALGEVPLKNAPGRIVEFLSEEALQTLLKQPDTRKRTEFRNQFFMILMYDTAARCGELLNMKVSSLRLNTRHPTAYLTGKGNKTRSVPLLSKTVEHCNRYLQMFHPNTNANDDDYLFYTVIHNINHPMSADIVAVFMKKYGELARQICPEVPVRVHPHQLRHTRAIHYYRAGMPLALLSEFLGHADPETTKVYAYTDTEMKRLAMEKADNLRKGAPAPVSIWENDEDMILKLSGLK